MRSKGGSSIWSDEKIDCEMMKLYQPDQNKKEMVSKLLSKVADP